MAFPVSVKGVVVIGGRVPLPRNERAEWELPGGRLESGEQPIETVRRELLEELAIAVEPLRAIDSWLYRVRPEREVLIVTYGCRSLETAPPRVSAEHAAWLAEIARTRG